MVSFRYLRIRLYKETRLVDLIIVFIIFIILYGIISDLIISNVSHVEIKHHKIDWHNWKLIEDDAKRSGLGEQGKPAYLSSYPTYSKFINDTYGYNGYLSDKIALDRSLKDERPPICRSKKYLSDLPNASVVIIFHNEYPSTLMRTCISVSNRSPPRLLKEIILIDDASTNVDANRDLQRFIEIHSPTIKLLRLKKRSGLIKARLEGAKLAIGDVIIFLDSHCEAQHNWLPPLLEPIANDHQTVVLPVVDVISPDTYGYYHQALDSGYGGRGGFDWSLNYKILPLLPNDVKHISKPYETPIMAGGLFAISAKYFWYLGGYDTGLDTYGGEQYEMSFKIWQCGGRMLEAACSRLGHIYRSRKKTVNTHLHYDFIHHNYKRVAEVWMDEYKEYVYNRHPDIYAAVDAGDLTEQKALRKRLKCKSFKWFMENVAFDLLTHYPFDEPSFAYGGIQSNGIQNQCVDTMGGRVGAPLGLFGCANNISFPHSAQSYSLTLEQDIRQRYEKRCWTVTNDNRVTLGQCQKKNEKTSTEQLWTYDMQKKWIINLNSGLCLDIDTDKRQLILNDCNIVNVNMKWDFGNINSTAIAHIRNTRY